MSDKTDFIEKEAKKLRAEMNIPVMSKLSEQFREYFCDAGIAPPEPLMEQFQALEKENKKLKATKGYTLLKENIDLARELQKLKEAIKDHSNENNPNWGGKKGIAEYRAVEKFRKELLNQNK